MKTYPIKKLGEVIDFLPKSRRRAGDGLDEGKYLFFSSSQDKIKYLNEADYKDEAVVLGTGGSASVHIAKNFSTSADVFIIKSSNINSLENRYLYLFLVANISVLNQGFKGAALKHLSKEYVKNLEIPLPPLGEQKKIVAKLESLLAKITEAKKLRAEAQANTDNLLPAELHKIFEEGKKKGWEEKSIQEVTKVVTKGTTPKTLGHAFTESGVPFLKAENVNGGVTDASSTRTFISKQTHNLLSRSKTKSGDVLMTIAGTIGRLGWIPEAAPEMNMNQAVAIIRPRRDAISTQYLAYVLSAGISQGQVITGTVKAAIPNFSLGMIKKIKIPLPPLAEQKKIVAWLDSFSEKIKRLQEYQQLATSDLLALEQSILHNAFSNRNQ